VHSVTDSLLSSLGYISSVLALVAAAVGAIWLHELKPERRPARNAVITITVVSAVFGFIQAWRSGLLAQTVSVLNKTVTVDGMRIDDLKRQLADAEQSQRLLRKAATADAASIADLRTRLSIAEDEHAKESDALRSAVADARGRIAAASAQNRDLRRLGETAVADANAASRLSRRTAADVAKTDAETIGRSKEALALAQSAAEKARVFHFGDSMLSAASAALVHESAGISTIACVPGYETACKDLRSMFVNAGWPTPFIIRAASLYTGGGLDAPTDPNPDAGLLIFYRPGREQLARSLANILAPAGFTVGVYPLSFNPGNHEFEISVRFLDQ
jgi:hypothetical protein